MSFNSTALGMGYAPEPRGLSYPSVPPPSLSSSFGSPTVPLLHISNGNGRDVLLSPIEPLSRRNSNAGSNVGGSGIVRRGSLDRRIMESGSLRGGSGSGSGGGRSRRGSFDHGVPIGGRLAESGTLLGRSRGGSLGVSGSSGGGGGQLPETVDEVEDSSSSSPLSITMEFGEVSNDNNSSSGSGTRMLDAGDLDIPSTKSR